MRFVSVWSWVRSPQGALSILSYCLKAHPHGCATPLLTLSRLRASVLQASGVRRSRALLCRRGADAPCGATGRTTTTTSLWLGLRSCCFPSFLQLRQRSATGEFLGWLSNYLQTCRGARRSFGFVVGWMLATSHFARVVKGVDLRSTAGNSAWVRTPQVTFSLHLLPWRRGAGSFRGLCAGGDRSIKMTPAGLEPAIPGSVGRCLIHWATGPRARAAAMSAQLPLTCATHLPPCSSTRSLRQPAS